MTAQTSYRATGPTVLIADDNKDLRSLVSMRLSMQTDAVVVGQASDGVEALELARELQPDIILLDLAMPRMDGLEALPMLRADVPRARIVIFSGFGRGRLSEEAKEAGADAYVEKGSSLDSLLAAMAIPERPEPAPEVAVAPQPGETAVADEATVHVLDMVAHECRPQLAIIRGFAEILERKAGALTSQDVVQAAVNIGSAVAHLDQLLSALDQHSAAEVRPQDLTRSPFDLALLVHEVLAALRLSLGDRRVLVETTGITTVVADRTRVRQVVTNLVTNAGKHTAPDGAISVTVSRVEGGSRLRVRDNGPGVPPDALDRLFTKYGRLSSSVPGVGLGLYLARGIARAHGGELTYRDAPGGGAIFELELPDPTVGTE